MRLGCLARILLTLDVLIEAATAVNDEIATHIHCLQEHELTPEDRNHIEQNLADGVERALQVIGMHLFQYHGCIEGLGLDSTRLAMFLHEIEAGKDL